MTQSTVQAIDALEVTFERQDRFISFFIKGGYRRYRVMKSCWNEIAEKSREADCDRILLECDIPGESSVTDVFDSITYLSDHGLRRHKIAVVDRRSEHRETNDFANLVAKNRGIRFRTFDSINAAKLWLNSN